MSKMADKIRRLLALATSSNPHEAALAAAKAQELMLKYNVDQDELEKAAAANDSFKAEPVGQEVGWEFGKTFPVWYLSLGSAMARSFLVKTYWTTGVGRIWVVGRESNRAAFKATWDYVRGAIQQLADSGWAALTPEEKRQTHPRSWKTGFCTGAVNTIATRLRESDRDLPGGMAIVLRDRNKEVEAWMASNLALRKGASHSLKRADGYAEGKRAGWGVDLGRRSAKYIGGGGS